MRVPIQYALSHPARWDAPLRPLTSPRSDASTSRSPTTHAFPCLTLALDAGRGGGTLPAAMNAANEVAVAAFLAGMASFSDIPRVVSAVMDAHIREELVSVDQVERVDRDSRALARRLL